MAIQTGVAIPRGREFSRMWAAIVGAIVVGLLLATFAVGALSDRGAAQTPVRTGAANTTSTVQYPRAPYRAPQTPASYSRPTPNRAPMVNAAHAEARG
jgi:hypothetical protein